MVTVTTLQAREPACRLRPNPGPSLLPSQPHTTAGLPPGGGAVPTRRPTLAFTPGPQGCGHKGGGRGRERAAAGGGDSARLSSSLLFVKLPFSCTARAWVFTPIIAASRQCLGPGPSPAWAGCRPPAPRPSLGPARCPAFPQPGPACPRPTLSPARWPEIRRFEDRGPALPLAGGFWGPVFCLFF